MVYGDKYRKDSTEYVWREVIEAMYDLRKILGPIFDYEYLSWPL